MRRADPLSYRKAQKRGSRSEIAAAVLLMLKGYRILGRGVRTHAGEIDLVAKSPSGIICFIEVKARTALSDAQNAVGARQKQRISRAAGLFLAARPGLERKGVRYDVIAQAKSGLPRHFRDVWRPGD